MRLDCPLILFLLDQYLPLHQFYNYAVRDIGAVCAHLCFLCFNVLSGTFFVKSLMFKSLIYRRKKLMQFSATLSHHEQVFSFLV